MRMEPEQALPARWRQTMIGLALAGLLIASWLSTHAYAVWFHHWTAADALAAPVVIAWQCWLSVGLFIIAHDAMHGSLAPGRPRVNRVVGGLALVLYAGFAFDDLALKHRAHHRHAGTADDPDFHADDPRGFWPWYLAFMRAYANPRQIGTMAVLVTLALVLGAHPANVLAFWLLPALLSSMQLFLFGTYLPHRHEDEPFADRHRARSSRYPAWLSLLTCFHFGHHHEHHLTPGVPWWRLHKTGGAPG